METYSRKASAALLVAREEHMREQVAVVAEEVGVEPEQILGRGGDADVSSARQILMTRLWLDGLSLSQIARLVGRNHATVLYSVRRMLGAEKYAELSPGQGRCA